MSEEQDEKIMRQVTSVVTAYEFGAFQSNAEAVEAVKDALKPVEDED